MYKIRLTLLAAFLANAFFSNAQNVGIGVERPGSKLSVKGGISIGETYAEKPAPDGVILIEKSMGIGTDTIDPNVVLDIRSTTKGVLFPTMNTQKRNSIINPPKGLFVFNEDSSGFNFYNGASWLNFALLGPTGPIGAAASLLGLGANNSVGGYAATSVSLGTIGTGNKIFLTQLGLSYRANDRVRISNAANKYMEGTVTSYVAGTLTVNVDRVVGSGTFLSWNIGLAGDVGTTGPAGAQGIQGVAGLAGARGATGSTGATGAQGIQGIQGVTGAQGPVGAVGLQGPAGVAGPAGAQGPAGAVGAQGPQGNMVRTGAGVPAGTLGNVGDFYLNANDANYYLKTGTTTWVYVGNLKGEQGDQGADGAQGAQGPQGPAGAVGAKGATGATGAQGIQGIQGAAGPQGVAGAQGPAGAVGAQGPAGTAGAVGAQGPAGPAGAAGTNGAAGAAGAVGAKGATGATGAQGTQGIQGVAGPQGVAGAQGPAGAVGAQGPAGTAGAAGPAGAAGANGANGATWLNGTGVPANATGAINDFYLNSSNGTYYKKTAATTWTSQGSLKGATGANGPAGAAGAQGPVGAVGAQGPAGAVGAAGVAGSNGSTWLTGNNAPGNGVGNINDMYLASSNGSYYKKTAVNTWTSQGSLKGPAGVLSNGSVAGNTPYWNGSSWVVNSSNIFNNGANVGIGTTAPTQKFEVNNGSISINNNNNTAGQLVMFEPSSSGNNYTAFKARAQAANITYNLPPSQTANTMLLNDGSGNLSWAPVNQQVISMFERKTSNQSSTSSTFADDNDFTYTLEPNQTYEISGLIRISAHKDGEWKMQFAGPTGSQALISMAYNTEYLDEMIWITAPNTTYYMLGEGADPNADVVFVNGTVTTGNTGGIFKFKWAQKNTFSTATTIYANSYIRLTRVE